MAGSGKTTFLQRLNAHFNQHSTPAYIMNLDPAVMQLPYSPNIDIRDTVSLVLSLHFMVVISYQYQYHTHSHSHTKMQVNYKNVMKQYQLGPNGGILTSLNLFATRFDQVISLCERPRSPPLQYIIADTPGQIEIFTWSASGAIITEACASTFPTMIAYVIDTPRCVSPQSFMTNMLQACSILYKTRLPLLLVFNKVDVASHQFALDWMRDFEVLSSALDADGSYSSSLSRSLSLVLEDFYESLQAVGVSAVTGEGMDGFLKAVEKCRNEYESEYLPELMKRKKEKDALEEKRKEEELKKWRTDVSGGGGSRGGGGARG